MKQKKGWTNLFKVTLTLLILAASILYAQEKIDNPLVETTHDTSRTIEEQERGSSARPLPAIEEAHSNLPFLIDTLCMIIDPTHSLDPFLDELDQRLAGEESTIQIVHLGDSHVQAGFYSGTMMRLLQQTFGNAGRGWIAPYKLAKSNEPFDYYISSSQKKDWNIARYTQPGTKRPCGPGAISIATEREPVDFTIRIAPEKGEGYDFNQVICYRDINTPPLQPLIEENMTIETIWGTEPYSPQVMIDTFNIAENTQSLKIISAEKNQEIRRSKKSCFYGFVLTNGSPGILYHSIGQNGAMYINYTNPEYIHQLSLLDPSLLIITLGTNESFGNRFNAEQFTSQVDDFIRLIREQLPLTTLILSTPAECFQRTKKGFRRNEKIGEVAKALLQYAQKEGIACFDLYHMTGGVNSCKRWAASNYLGRDKIHYTEEGYQEQGILLYNALIRLKSSRNKTAER